MPMRKKANLSLVVLLLLFIGSAICLYVYPSQWWPRMLLYITEAGLVGALADLFAVTVLFRHPFGLKWVPHTAIIPRNRDKLVDGVVQLVEEQLLSKDTLMDKVKQLQIVERIILWADQKQDGKFIEEQGWQLLTRLLAKINITGLSVRLDEQARERLRQVNMAPYAGKALQWALDHSKIQDWLGELVHYAAQRVSGEEVKIAIREMLQKEKDKFVNEGNSFTRWFKQKVVQWAESSDAINIDEATETLYTDLQKLMEELKNPKHELRVLLENMLYKLSHNFQTSENLAQTVNDWRDDMLNQLSLQPSIEALLQSIKHMLIQPAELKHMMKEEHVERQAEIKQWVTELLSAYWNEFKSDQEMKDMLEQYIQQFISKMVVSEHRMIGQIVRRTLDDFTEQRLVSFIESKVETDLQRIRLNGALVGAAIGGLIYGFLHGIYSPLLQWFA